MEISKLNGFEIRDDKAREQAKAATDAFNAATPVINKMNEDVNALIRANVNYDERITAADKKATAAAEKASEADDAAYNYNYRMNERVTIIEDRLNNGEGGGGVTDEVILSWEAITGKPETFPPESHTHTAADVGAKPSSYVPAWDEVTGKPETFPPKTHTHTAADVGAKPADYVPTWDEVTGKPNTFPPETHSHTAADVGAKPADYVPAWGEVTGKPSLLSITELWSKDRAEFSAGSITVNGLNTYPFILLIYAFHTSLAQVKSEILPKGWSTMLTCNTYSSIYRRNVTVDGDSITFSSSIGADVINDASSVEDNSYLVPIRIYGIG